MYYIESTLASSVTYCKYDTSRNDMNILKAQVTIKGKTGVRDKITLQTLSGGTITAITDEQFEWLKDDPLFNFHKDKGFIKVFKNKSDAERQAEKKADVRDNSTQMKPEDFVKQGLKKPAVTVEELLKK